VLYIATEDVQGCATAFGVRRAHPEAAGTLTWLQMPKALTSDYNQVAELIEAVEPYAYDHIVLDTLREAHRRRNRQPGIRGALIAQFSAWWSLARLWTWYTTLA